ncbi:ABC transporter ATP-binding protein [Priestia megaterium]|uniref:ATP-binding cassette domain-containing protein n=1 Tax=Priestia megaterium TaxID=1404 RepID=A0A6M6E5W0_PRIMG|nr:ABC transporter ATP-binding protein [Priestia megaterium]QJX79897.1 ATP-binding cassette domain-containing protein [Priestia megaterium]
MLISLEEINKQYTVGDEVVKALDNVSLEIEKGEFLAIVGPSGSGKSTLMNILGCLDIPTSGKYILDGITIEDAKENELSTIRNQKIGFIFQNFNLLTKLTAIENVELPLIYRGVKQTERRKIATESLEKVGLGERIHHLPTKLSGGQQQRVAIARALAGNPPILLCDEPTGALDSVTSRAILELLKELNKQGHTIIIITHDLEVANQAKRVVQIKDGKLASVKVGGKK